MPAIVYYFLFHYLPMYGLVIAFKDFSLVSRHPAQSVGRIRVVRAVLYFGFTSCRTVRNTLLLNLYGFFFNFTVPIIFALLLNEVAATECSGAGCRLGSYIPQLRVDRGRGGPRT